MLYTMHKVLEELSLDVGATPYHREAPCYLDTVFDAAPFFEAAPFAWEDGSFGLGEALRAQYHQYLSQAGYPLLCGELADVKAEIEAKKGDVLRIMELRQLKKQLQQQMAAISRDFYARQSLMPEGGNWRVVQYKGAVEANSLGSVCGVLPCLEGLDLSRWHGLPLFTRHLAALKSALEDGLPLAVEGGPCLFGTDEVTMCAEFEGGGGHCFDFNTAYITEDDKTEGESVALDRFLKDQGHRIARVSFKNGKTRVNAQEVENIRCLFEIASRLGASLVVTVPDHSYVRYLASVSQDMRPGVRAEMLRAFEKVTGEIARLYLALAGQMQRVYHLRRMVCMHGGNRALREKFEAARDAVVAAWRPSRRNNRFSSRLGRDAATLDYITFPALPYHLWGVRNILEVNVLNETDSIRKCAQIYGGEIELSAMMYPEMMSADGERTIFYAKQGDKVYL